MAHKSRRRRLNKSGIHDRAWERKELTYKHVPVGHGLLTQVVLGHAQKLLDKCLESLHDPECVAQRTLQVFECNKRLDYYTLIALMDFAATTLSSVRLHPLHMRQYNRDPDLSVCDLIELAQFDCVLNLCPLFFAVSINR